MALRYVKVVIGCLRIPTESIGLKRITSDPNVVPAINGSFEMLRHSDGTYKLRLVRCE